MSTRPTGREHRISRRSLLQGGLAGAGMLAIPGLAASCTSAGGGGAAGNGMSFMYWGSSYEDEVVRTMLDAFAEGSGTPMTPMFTTGTEQQYNTKLNTLVAGGTPPDVLYLHDYKAYELAEKNLLLNVVDYFDQYPNLEERLPGTYYFWDEGKCLGNQTGTTANLLYYKKGSFDDAGLEYPPAVAADAWDWDTFIERADALTFDSNGRHPSESGFDPNRVEQFGVSNFFGQWYPFVAANGGDVTDPTGMEYWL
uniref:extracellular solute-binding protein n=1 Tax=Pseudactinotalea sp. TaxID=1926260 RepID=UPI003B3BB6CB